MSVKTLLALDFSSSYRSVALMEVETRKLLVRSQEPAVFAPAAHTNLDGILFVIKKLLDDAGLTQKNISILSLGIGPCSYTGVRASIALAQGWSLAADIKLAAVSSMDALAFQASRLGWKERCHILVDAQRSEVYHAAYQLTANPSLLKPEEPPKIVSKESLLALSKGNEKMAGPDLDKSIGPIHPLYPLAEDIAIISLSQSLYLEPEDLAPIYLRPTQFTKAKPTRTLPL